MSKRVDLYRKALACKSTQPHRTKTQQHTKLSKLGNLASTYQLKWENVTSGNIMALKMWVGILTCKEENETIMWQDHDTT